MRFGRSRRSVEEEGESYFVSMTDIMVGVIFIFIIMLSFFALQYRSTTASLTQAKDAQTAVLLQVATALERRQADIEVDRAHHVVCVPATVLVGGDNGKRCFAYSPDAMALPAPAAKAEQSRKALVGFVSADLASAPAQASAENGTISFSADQLFEPNSANLSAGGRNIARTLAGSLAARLPCYGYGAPAPSSCTGEKMSVVNVATSASFDAFTDAGREAAALALRRSVAFHDALVAERPVLGQLTNAPTTEPAAQPLLRVASFGQSQKSAPAAGQGQTVSIQFQMAQ